MSTPLRLTWLGHSTMVLDVAGTRLLTDPLLRSRAGPLLRRGPVPRPEQWAGADAVLVSHLHHDHADLPSLRRVDAPVLTAGENAAFLHRRLGLPAPGLDRGGREVGGAGVRVRLTRADHAHRPMPHRPNAAHGHLVLAEGLRIWVAGDTGLYEEMAEIPALAGGPVDVAVVPVGGWGPRLSGGHMTPADAARACRLVGARVAVPYHWGTLFLPGTTRGSRRWLETPGPSFAAALEAQAPGCRAVVLEPGGAWEC